MPEVKSFTLLKLKEYLYGLFPPIGAENEGIGSTSLKVSTGQDLGSSSADKQSRTLSVVVLVELCGLGNELMCEGLRESCEKLIAERIDDMNVVSILMVLKNNSLSLSLSLSLLLLSLCRQRMHIGLNS